MAVYRVVRALSVRAAIAGGLLAIAGVLLAPVPGAAQDRAPAAARAGADLLRCGSVVVRHCVVRAALPSVVRDTGQGALIDPSSDWASARLLSLEEDEIVVSGQSLHGPDITGALTRVLGAPRDASGLASVTLASGSRCTVIARTGAAFCTSPAGTLPQLERPLADWVF